MSAAETIRYKRSRFSTRLPVDRRYTRAHYWLQAREPGLWRIGLTKFATRMLGDLVEYEFSVQAGHSVELGQSIGWIEGFKAVSDVYAVASGKFNGVNAALTSDITLLESDPYGDGWLYEIAGDPDPRNVDVQDYVNALDATIDRMLASRREEIRMHKAAYVMIGGFLGAGKTTAVIRFAEYLTERGKTVGLITNDQSIGLVDTALVRSQGFSVEEITGGCFCCRFNSLVEAADKLSVTARPDVFIAEPVGSCTDLRAAVSYPLRRIYGDDYEVAPLSVLVDPMRAMRVLGLESGRSFSEKVLYVYDRQLAEADLIIINKLDLLNSEQLETLRRALEERYPEAQVLAVSSRNGDGLETWFDYVSGAPMGLAEAPDVDYEIYAEGEALLGWMNATVQLSADAPFDGNETLRQVASSIAASVASGEIAHLKMTLTPEDEGGDIAVLNLVGNELAAEFAHQLKEPLDSGELIVNLRAEEDPEKLRAAALAAFSSWESAQSGRNARIEHIEHFRPGKPQPTYRMASV